MADAVPTTRPVVLIVEDMTSLSLAYAAHLEQAGMDCLMVDNAADALTALAKHRGIIRAILLDIQLPDMDGLTLLTSHPDIAANCPVVVATADGSINRAIEAMRLGAFDFLVKPLSGPRLVKTMTAALQVSKQPDAPEPTAEGFQGFIGISPPMQAVYRQIGSVARSRATVFITGESGTGKEVAAEAIHRSGPRAAKPFVAINCGAIPEDLLESELFGHLKGSFTGAVSDRVGAVQAAQGGTLFLDEICEMQLHLQVKLLRFLQTGTVQRVGAARTEDVDVRIICATNRHPESEVAAGRFREDLFYRLAVVPIHLPPLRARGHDIELLANHFLQRFAREEGKNFRRIPADTAMALAQHAWPGNVRELQNMIRRAAVMQDGPDLPLAALPALAAQRDAAPAPMAPPQLVISRDAVPLPASGFDLASALEGMTLDAIERLVIDHAIARAGGSLPLAARQLGLSPSTLYRKRERWGDQAQSA